MLLPLLITVPMGIAVGGLFALTVAEAYGWLPRPSTPAPDSDSTSDPKDPTA